MDGGIIKVILGSQIAGEGLDLRFIREIHILDAWFHLNKTEQIIGRGIRFCSHSLIKEPEKHNTTIFLHTIVFPKSFEKESADLHCYRTSLQKAILIGQVSRKLKQFAIDCNLRKNVTVLSGLGNRIQIDSQNNVRKGTDPKNPGISIDDTPFTALCDWMECQYECSPNIDINMDISDDSTYDVFSARYRESILQKIIQKIFKYQPYYSAENLLNVLLQSGIPRIAIDMILQSILNNHQLNIKHGSQEGYIIYKNKYFLFQPNAYTDLKIPMALRIADFSIKQDAYTPKVMKPSKPLLIGDSNAAQKYTLLSETLKKEEKTNNDVLNALIEWTNRVIAGTQTSIGIEIERQIEVFTGDFKQQRALYLDKLHTILYLSKKNIDKAIYKKVILEHIWDEWIRPEEQVQLLLANRESYSEFALEQIIQSGSITAFRSVNAESNELQYTCMDGKPCSRIVIQAFNTLETDVVKKRTHDIDKVGSLYGVIVPKRGTIIFKTIQPEQKFKAVSGQECGIVTTKSHWLEKLIYLGNELEKHGVSRMDLDKGHLGASTDIINTTRGCTLLNLVLRYMDYLQVDGKRWFFRPIAAYVSGHRGLVSASVKVASKVAQKKLKEEESFEKKEEKKKEKEKKKELKKIKA